VSVRVGWFRSAVYSCRLREAKEAGDPTPGKTAGEGLRVCVFGGGQLLLLACPKHYLSSAHAPGWANLQILLGTHQQQQQQ